jgi:hypothetical protein
MDGRFDDRPMPQMNPVENSDRQMQRACCHHRPVKAIELDG